MNTNKKHKSKNKSKPNPTNTGEKVELISEAEQKDIKEVGVIVENVPKEESGKEIISENVIGSSDKAAEPKKPKRNKNKKKQEYYEGSVEKPETRDDMETGEISENKPDTESNDDFITPTARKKKNKNKKSELQSEIITDKVLSEQEAAKQKKVEETEDKNKAQDISISPVPEDTKTEQESKSAKKKNKKKKNRNDSERSDKAEEIISCTAAFQKLMEVKTENQITPPEVAAKTVEQQKPKDVIRVEAENEVKTDDDTQKNKKKNKKGKPVNQSEDHQQKLEPEKNTDDIQTKETIKQVENKQTESELVCDVTTVTKMPSPKPKAKIAKPVEKKSKNKTEEADMLSSIILSKPENAPVVKESSETKSEPEKEMTSNTENIVTITNVPETKKDDLKVTPKTIETTFIKKKEDQLSGLNKSSLQENVALSQIFDKKSEEAFFETKSKDETIADEVKEGEIVNVAVEEPKSRMSKNSNKKNKNKTDVHETVSSVFLPQEQTIDIPSQEKQDLPKLVPKEPIIIEEKSQQDLENLDKTSKSKETEPIMPQSVQVKSTAAVPLKPEEALQVTPSDKRRKKSPMKREIKEPKNQSEEYTKPDHVLESKSDQKEEANMQMVDLLTQEVKTTQLDCQLKETEKNVNITNVLEKCELSKGEDLQVPAHKNKKRKKSPIPPARTEPNIGDVTIDKLEHGHQQASEETKPSDEKQTTEQPPKDTETTQVPEKVPDSIHYPRSLSHSIVDPNNNASVREIKTPEQFDIGLFEIPHTAIIEGSGSSPTTTEVKIPNIQGPHITEVLGNDKEKTDLKSKVLEVNKDMEVLRLSIERSLAELTCLEQKEQDIDKPKEDDMKNIQKIASESEKESKQITEISQEHKTSDNVVVTTADSNKEITMQEDVSISPPVCPARQDKGKGKSKKKNKQDSCQTSSNTQIAQQSASSQPSSGTSTDSKPSQSEKKDTETSEKKNDTKQDKGKQSDGNEKRHAENTKKDSAHEHESAPFQKSVDTEPIYSTVNKALKTPKDISSKTVTKEQYSSENVKNAKHGDYEPIENFEDAMTSSMDDVNKSFEMIASEDNIADENDNPAISITAPEEDKHKKDEKDKINPVSQPKNLLGHIDIPVPSNRTDYKKEKNKTPNARQAKVKIKDSAENEPAKTKESKQSQTEAKKKLLKKDTTIEESVPCLTNENEEFVYKYSFRKVFLPNVCHICKKELKSIRVPCNFCSLIFYCSDKHKDEGWQQHQGLCFAVSTVAHHKGQKHIYADSKNITGNAYRLFRMQTILACEKVLKRKLLAWEQETLLYPRICADPSCREFRQSKLKDCDGCGQVFFCAEFPEHLPKTHQRWCKSYNLYHKLVHHQQTQGRLAPKLPTKVLTQTTLLPDKINMMLATLYEEKIDMNDIQYAALTQIATAPLTAAYSYQLYSRGNANVISKSTFTIHIVGAELQYEADALNKWETLFLHLKPEVMQLNVVMICALNPSDLPLDLLGKVKLCANCRLHSRRLVFHFQDKKSYYEYWDSNDFLTPDIVCSFNPSIQRCTVYNGKDQWPITISTIFKQKCPFVITSYTMNELNRDLNRIKESSTTEFKVLSEAKFNPFASVRPDRNFITDDESPLLFKNFCFAVLCAA